MRYIDEVCDDDARRRAQNGLADAVDAFCEGIAFSPEQTARVFAAAKAPGLPVKLHADQLSNLHGAKLAAELRRAVGRSSRIHRRGRRRRDGAAPARSPCCCPARSTSCAKRKLPPVDAFRRHGVPMAIATDCNPGTSPLTSLLLTMNMARDAVPPDGRRVPRRRHARSGARARPPRRDRHARTRQVVRPRHLGHRAAGRAGLPHRLQSAACAGLERADDRAVDHSTPGARPLAEWRAIYRGAARRARSRCRRRRSRPARGAIDAIVAKGEPVYGINTGFGKLASVRIDAADLATLQRNIVLSHAAGVGEPLPVPVVRLMMALKLASLAPGRLRRALATVAHARSRCSRAGLMPVDPGAGLGRRVGRSRAARAHDGGA